MVNRMNPGWTIIDSEKRATNYPNWAHTPKVVLDKIKPGYYVKIALASALWPGEWFWCRVFQVSETGFRVVVSQDMIYGNVHGVNDRQEMFIERRHVLGVLDGNMESVWEANRGR